VRYGANGSLGVEPPAANALKSTPDGGSRDSTLVLHLPANGERLVYFPGEGLRAETGQSCSGETTR
jgi:hypothetical protein